MKRLFVALLCLMCIFNAHADNNNVATSKNYVDAQIATLQDEVPAINSNTVLTHTGTSGEIGSKKIYDANSDYGSQTDALMTAGAFNSAVQNAIETEFVCIDWLGEHVPGNCLLWKIQNKTPQQIVPDGYTPVEYIKSDGDAWFNTNIAWASVTRFRGKAQQKNINSTNRAVLGSSSSCSSVACFFGTYYLSSAGGKTGWYWHSSVSPTSMAEFDAKHISDTSWVGNVNNISISSDETLFTGDVLVMTNNSSSGYGYRSFNGSVWYIQLFGPGDTMLFNGIPARRNSDNELGMYDTVSNTFFTNSGSGTFVAGPDMNSNLYLPTGN